MLDDGWKGGWWVDGWINGWMDGWVAKIQWSQTACLQCLSNSILQPYGTLSEVE